jgi:hypothetical protein
MKILALVASIIVMLFLCDLTYCETGSLPKELLEIAKRNGFKEVTGFYNRPGMIKPPYVYGYLPCDEENSAVFWCEKKEKGERRFYLMIMRKDNKCGQLRCPDRIQWHNYPGGLSIYKNMDTTLEHFYYINDPKRKPPKTERLQHNAILSEYDGVEELFYCYKGEWVVRIRH